MISDDSALEKEFEPTEHKLAEQRRKGEVPRSTDLNTAAALMGLLLAALTAGAFSVQRLGELGVVLLGQSDRLSLLFARGVQAPLGGVLGHIALAITPIFALPVALVLASLFLQRALIFAPEKLIPKMSRLSLIANTKQKFGRNGLFEFGKATVKLAIVTALLVTFAAYHLNAMLGSMTASPGQASVLKMDLILRFLALVLALWLVIGAVDYLWQRAEHLRQNRMSHQELRDEMKQTEGDPHSKAERRRRGREIASNRMLDAVAEASVVIVNPTHYAVALKWSPNATHAPICVAKGVDEIAARIRERAKTAGVAIHSDPTTARALYATVKLDQEIRPEHYAAVATAIRFAETLRSAARKGRVA
ncbi:MAG: flagellar biosynthesis protein FlhB [Roseinatronobacter sp.]